MNEDQASALFAPARERPVPPAAFSMADVFAADDRRRQRHRWGAVAGTVAVVVAVVLGSVLAATGSTHRADHPSTPQTPTPTVAVVPALAAIIDRLALPADAKLLAAPADGQAAVAPGYSDQPGYQQDARYWTSGLSPAEVIATMTASGPKGMTGGAYPPMPSKGPADAQAYYKAADSATLIGPRLQLYAIVMPDGRTAVSALAWQVVKSAKPAGDTVTDEIDFVTGTYAGNNGSHSLTLTGAKAQRLADAVNALLVSRVPPAHGCASATSLTLTFAGAKGDQTFEDVCGYVRRSPAVAGLPDLETSDQLNLLVNADFASLMPTPLPSSAPLPTAAADASDLAAVLDHFPVPPGSASTADVVLPSRVFARAGQTERRTAYWNSPLSRPATVTWLKQHLDARWTGDFNTTVGTNETDGMFTGPTSLTEYGPNLMISVVDRPGGAIIHVEAWEIPLAPKAPAETLTGVTGVTIVSTLNGSNIPLSSAPYSEAFARALAADINALPVDPGLGGSCTQSEPDLRATFTTARGARTFLISRNCRYVEPQGAKGPTLSTSEKLFTDLAPLDLSSAVGLLDVDITVAGGPKGTPTRERAAGTITISQGGRTVDQETVAKGHQLTTRLAAGSYQISATTGGLHCPAITAQVTKNRETGYTVLCQIK